MLTRGGRRGAQWLVAVAMVAAVCGCAWQPPTTQVPHPQAPPPPLAPAASGAQPLGATDVAALRARLREHAKAHCGSCHQSSRPSHKAAAIAIYDLDRDDWHTMLTVPRLQAGFPRRLTGRLDDAGRRDLQAFIAHEVALRQR
ncbi:MAG: hypothetical protein JNJ89_15060 [Rubrivivax sp.]|nr:hypothetical protein [Rubrivivax sp.]